MFSKRLPVISIIQITLSRPTIFGLNCSLKIEFNFAFFHSFQKHCTPCQLLPLHTPRNSHFSTTGKEKCVMVNVESS